ncbi:MAG: CHAP domain-containing protein, partial [Bacteroidetes bacterium]
GLVKSVNGGFITVIEGNTNDNGSREGIGVFERTRKVASINKGFIEYKM